MLPSIFKWGKMQQMTPLSSQDKNNLLQLIPAEIS